MAQLKNTKSLKRKKFGGANDHGDHPASKLPKVHSSKCSVTGKNRLKEQLKVSAKNRNIEVYRMKTNITKRDRRQRAKELTETRKKKRRRHYILEQKLAFLWEKMRCRNIAKEERSKLISEALSKMKGNISEIAGSHISSRVLQTCVKYCSQVERDAVFGEIRPHFITLACNAYSVHLLKKMLDNASKQQLAGLISSLHGHVASLLRHMVGSVVVEHAFQLGTATQKQHIIMELYSTELQLFKDLITTKATRLQDLITKLGLQKASVFRHMTSVIQPILEKGIVDHSIIHRVLLEYFTIANKSSAAEIIQQLSGPLLVRMIHTKDGSRVGILCVKHGGPKERKKTVKGMKGHVAKIALDQYGSMVLACILSAVDDTKLVAKMIVKELQKNLKDLALDKNGRRPLMQLLLPNSSRCFSPDDMESFGLSIPSLSTKDEQETDIEPRKPEVVSESAENADKNPKFGKNNVPSDTVGKKDPVIRRHELLIDSGLAEGLIDLCTEFSAEFLKSKFGKDIIYELATGGAGGILHPVLDEKISTLHKAIASLAAEPKSESPEHVLENFHSSRVVRKLVLNSPSFASSLWHDALQGRCETWVHGHSCKVVCAYMESSDQSIRNLAEGELLPLADGGILNLRSSTSFQA